jgi:secondary thiamine-phosphate synthase enzyme
MKWAQKTIRLPAYRRGCHLITEHVLREWGAISEVQIGLLHVFLQHTSASLSINENADPDVRLDMEMALNHIAPEDLDYIHTLEGTDDMPAHVKSSLIGCSLSIPISNGRLALGTWQGIYLCEHRDRAEGRSIVMTLQGN